VYARTTPSPLCSVRLRQPPTSAKRDGSAQRADHSTAFDFDTLPAADTQRASELCALDDALNDLGVLDPRQARAITRGARTVAVAIALIVSRRRSRLLG